MAGQRVRTWLLETALPLWATAGFDPGRDSFVEGLSLRGDPLSQAPRRLMVQARQIYCFATAQQLGWLPGSGDLVARAAHSLIRDYYQADGSPGWVMSVASGAMADPTRDLYAHAFVLLGLASAFQVTGEPRYLALADETLDFLDTHLSHPPGGFLSRPGCSELAQNPHMHLFEAMLALAGIAPRPRYFDAAGRLLTLCEQRFFQPARGVLLEYFTLDWQPLPSARGCIFEPGHHLEWVWLLRHGARLLGRQTDIGEALRRTAYQSGISSEGFLWSEIGEEGVCNASTRLWPHAEAVKAVLPSRAAADAWWRQLQLRFLDPAVAGCWHDLFDANGNLVSTHVPASSLYHIVCAMAEYERERERELTEPEAPVPERSPSGRG